VKDLAKSDFFTKKDGSLSVIAERFVAGLELVHLGHRSLHLQIRPGSSAHKRAEVMHDWHKALLHAAVPGLISNWERKLGVRVSGYFLQRMKTKWGSCNRCQAAHPTEYRTGQEAEGPAGVRGRARDGPPAQTQSRRALRGDPGPSLAPVAGITGGVECATFDVGDLEGIGLLGTGRSATWVNDAACQLATPACGRLRRQSALP
jgi:hypothetical protein